MNKWCHILMSWNYLGDVKYLLAALWCHPNKHDSSPRFGLRRWPNIEPTSGKRLVFAGWCELICWSILYSTLQVMWSIYIKRILSYSSSRVLCNLFDKLVYFLQYVSYLWTMRPPADNVIWGTVIKGPRVQTNSVCEFTLYSWEIMIKAHVW